MLLLVEVDLICLKDVLVCYLNLSSMNQMIINQSEITEYYVAAGIDPKAEMKDAGTTVDLGNGYAHRVGRCTIVQDGKDVKYW